ncbi:MAG: hypothetical protein ACLSAH_06080 [Bilophila wadsworthia]
MNTTVLEKIQSELERSGCDAFLLSGGDNMRYAAQVHLRSRTSIRASHSSCSPKAGSLS